MISLLGKKYFYILLSLFGEPGLRFLLKSLQKRGLLTKLRLNPEILTALLALAFLIFKKRK
jgi:hypothetical protein